MTLPGIHPEEPGRSTRARSLPVRRHKKRDTLASQADDEATPFLTFTPKNTVPESNRVSRQYTRRTAPMDALEFRSAFEDEAPLSQLSERPSAEQSASHRRDSTNSSDEFYAGYAALDNTDYSDTAQLTANAAGNDIDTHAPPPDNDPDPLTSPKDSVKMEKQLRHQSLNRMSTAIRRISRRVVNVRNDDPSLSRSSSIRLLEEESDGRLSIDTVHEPMLDEEIPMTPTTTTTTMKSGPLLEPMAPKDTDPLPPEHGSKIGRSIQLGGNSCWLFGPDNGFRQALSKVLRWEWTETVLMLLIAIHGIVLLIAGWGATDDPEPPHTWNVAWYQYVVLGVFCCYTTSILIRVIVYGLVLNPVPQAGVQSHAAFLRHSWNRVDAVSVVSYWIDFALLCTNEAFVGDTRRITVFRMLSSIILLRLLNISNGNRVILQSLKKAGPLLVNVVFFVLFFFIIFGIVGVQSFKGSFLRRCVWTDPTNSSNVEVLQQYCGGYYNASGDPNPYIRLDGGMPLTWYKGFMCEHGLECREVENPFGDTISFDNIFASMLLVMVIAGDQSWTDRMYDMMDAEYFVACLYFVIIVIVMNFWLINLFVAVINEMFAKVRDDSTNHSAFTTADATTVLADGGEGWSFDNRNGALAKKLHMSSLTRIIILTRPFWILLVAVDLVVMALKNNSMSPNELATLEYAELAFSMAFLVEIILRLASQRHQLSTFFKDKMNRTDCFLAVVTCIIWIPPIREHQAVYTWLTGFQVLRIYRLVVVVPRLRATMSRILGSVHGLINLVFFIVLATILCAIIAFQFFEGVLNDSDEEMRFFSIYNSFVALYQLFSGEDWTSVLYDAMEAGAPAKNSAIYALFLVLWFAFSNFVLVNMFIAILMENFETAEEEKRQRQIQDYVEKKETRKDVSDPVVSKWNIYRHFRPQPKSVAIKDMPTNLILPMHKSTMREFMNGVFDQSKLSVHPTSVGPEPTVPNAGKNRLLTTVHGLLSKVLSSEKNDRIVFTANAHRQSMNFDGMALFEQFNTFYDANRSRNKDEPRSLRAILNHNLRETVAARSADAILHHQDERRSLQEEFIYAHPSYDKSLYIFSPKNKIRRWCQLLVPTSRGERTFGTPPSPWGSVVLSTLIVCCVITNVVLTIYNSPVFQFKNRHNPDKLLALAHADWAFTIIFTVEFVIKVIADGFWITPNAYLLNGWNMLDFFVLITLYMSNFGKFAASTGLERGFRAFKALRALRLVNLLKPAKETFTAVLVVGLPRILDAAALGLCLIVPFALYGKNIFMGLFYQCNDDSDSITTRNMCVYEGMLGTQEPMPDSTAIYQPRVWSNPYVYSFDSFWSALLVLFEIASGEGWVDVMTTSMGIVGKDQSPRRDASQLWGIFFMVYNLAGSVFVISLFLGVVLENFAKRNGTAYLTTDQRRWLDLKKLLSHMRPAKRPKKMPTGWLRKRCFEMTVDKRGQFYKIMTAVITLNILLLCTDTDHDESVPGLTTAKGYIYLGFIFIYWTEISIKLLGLGWSSFRRNLWNLYDLIVVFGSAITVIAMLGSQYRQVNVESQKLFMTALCFKLVQRSDSLNQLFTTMATSAYQIANVFAVWFVVLTTYAIMFMEIFGLTKYGSQSTTEYVNFRTYGNTMISLIRYSTGEGWNTVMHDFTVEEPYCQTADSYLDSDCGSLRWAYFLFLTFNIISMYIFTAVFLAVVADNFSYVYQIAANFSLVNRDEIRKFKQAWAEFDVGRSGYMLAKDYMAFWRKLSGIFHIRIYDKEFSYKALASECAIQDDIGYAVDDPYRIKVDLVALGRRLNMLDKTVIHRRKRDMDLLYWEAAMLETSKGISFNQMLLLLAQRKLIVPENALILEELLVNRKKEETLQTLIKMDRVKGLIETIAFRKKFLQHLQDKKRAEMAPKLPSIVVDNVSLLRIHTPEEALVSSRHSGSIHDVPSSETTYTNDADELSLHSPNIPSPTLDRHSIELEADRQHGHDGFPVLNDWHHLLQEEMKDDGD